MIAQERKVDTSKGAVALKCWGDASQPRLLALHGWLDNANSFDRLAPLLADFYWVAVDLPGHGRSAHRRLESDYYIWDILEVLQTLVKTLGWSEFNLLGHSMGAAVASLFAGTFPEQVTKLALLEGIGTLPRPVKDAPRQLRKGIEENLSDKRAGASLFNSAKEAIQARTKGLTKISYEAAETLAQRSLMEGNGQHYWGHDQRLKLTSKVSLTEEQVRAFLTSINAPTLLLLAEQGMLPEALVTARAAQVADIDVVKLPGQHHFHLEEQAPLVADKLRSFFLP